MNARDSHPPPGASRAPVHRHSIDWTSNRPSSARMPAEPNGAMPMPTPSHQQRGSMGGMPSGENGGNMGHMAMPRSPPKNKNTQFVPCKFFLQGQCQAGRMCPFSHDAESASRPAPCKYFSKGGCKFGRKCALLHVTPDGTVVNRHQSAPIPHVQPSQHGNFTQHQQHQQPAPPGLLSMQAQGMDQRPKGDGQPHFDSHQYLSRNGHDSPQIDMTYTPASPHWGSPPHDHRLAGSPPGNGLSVLDAPLPNSFDSNGVSMAARNGPFAASVPAHFESPPSSLPRRSQLGNTALRDLHNSAFGGRGMDKVLAGSSPPSGSDEPLTFPKRTVATERLRGAHNKMISASLGTKLPTTSFEYSDDSDGDSISSDREEDLLPASLHDLIPQNRTRRESRPRPTQHADDENFSTSTPASFLAAQRRTISTHGTPQDSKLASPHAHPHAPPPSSSPSRWNNSIWTPRTSSHGRGPEPDGFAPGPVGSPLRNSGFPDFPTTSLNTTPAASSASRPPPANGELSPSIASPPRQASMSMLTQDLQRTKLDAVRSSQGSAARGSRTVSGGSAGSGRRGGDRAISSHSVGRERIAEEEQELFDMDEVGGGRGVGVNGGERGFGAIGGERAK